MADLHEIKRSLSRVDIEMIADAINEVSGSLGVLVMIAGRVNDNEMAVDPSEFAGMMEMMRGQLVRQTQRLRAAI